MENKKDIWNKLAGIAVAAGSIFRGKTAVQQIVELKIDRAKFRIDQLVDEIILVQNRELLGAILDEFGNQIEAAETREFQNEVNDLLWYFKERVMRVSGNGTTHLP